MRIRFAFCNLLILATLTGCTSKSQPIERAADTLVTIVPDTAIDPVTGLRPGEYIDPESLPKVYTTYDSLQEFNTIEGIFKTWNAPVDPAVKLYFYASDFYSEPVIHEGEELTAVFKQAADEHLTFYRLEPTRFKYDSAMGYAYPPMIEDETHWPEFYLKGVELREVKGKIFPHSFIDPGTSFVIRLNDRTYTFAVEGKADRIQNPGWALTFIRNYRLTLSETSGADTRTVLLLERKFMPYPNEGDGSWDFLHWAGDLNNDGFIDIMSGDAAKVCATYYLWLGAAELKFKLTSRFSVCGC